MTQGPQKIAELLHFIFIRKIVDTIEKSLLDFFVMCGHKMCDFIVGKKHKIFNKFVRWKTLFFINSYWFSRGVELYADFILLEFNSSSLESFCSDERSDSIEYLQFIGKGAGFCV